VEVKKFKSATHGNGIGGKKRPSGVTKGLLPERPQKGDEGKTRGVLWGGLCKQLKGVAVVNPELGKREKGTYSTKRIFSSTPKC